MWLRHGKSANEHVECCFTEDMTISDAFRLSLSQIATLDMQPFVPTLSACLEPRGDGSRVALGSVCTFCSSQGR
jgi:hypothetical protein